MYTVTITCDGCFASRKSEYGRVPESAVVEAVRRCHDAGWERVDHKWSCRKCTRRRTEQAVAQKSDAETRAEETEASERPQSHTDPGWFWNLIQSTIDKQNPQA